MQVLHEFMREFNQVSQNDTVSIEDIGFQFTWGMCRLSYVENTFRKAMKRLIAVGFVDCPARLQSAQPASAYRYIASQRWRDYQLDDAERERADRFERAKRKRLRRQGERKQQVLRDMCETDNTGAKQIGPSKNEGNPHAKIEGILQEEDNPSPQETGG